jgi:putative inorganic carbon (HCO3(-)) transporter
MRDLFFLVFFLPMPFLSFSAPWAGMLLWGWLSLLNPHRDLWSFAAGLPYNQTMAIATILGWLISGERKLIRPDTAITLIVLLFLIMSISSFYSLAPEITWPKWNEFYKIMLYGLLLTVFLDRKARFHAVTWLLTGCIGFFAVKGAVLFILSGGSHQFEGPPGSAITDRNHLAAAMLMAVPLMNYLRLHSANSWIRRGLVAAMAMSVFAVIGTYSRGGFIGLVALGAFLWWRSRQKLVTLVLAPLIAAPLPYLVPEQWTARMRTIETAEEQDDSFKLRLLSWQTYFKAALDRPLTGAGIYALNNKDIYFSYMPFEGGIDVKNEKGRAAHSIYFQVLGELGFVAFFIYFGSVAATWWNTQRVIRHARHRPELLWAGDLARMIQVSIWVFLVTGAALSLAFYDLYFILLALASSLRALVASASPALTHNAVVGLQVEAPSRGRQGRPELARQARSR